MISEKEGPIFKQSELLTCIILTYNQKQYLCDCIKSVLNQNYPFIELIVTDDGSAEFDEKVLVDFIEKYKKNNLVLYKIFHHKSNVGTVKNINNAISLSNGSFLKMIGGDDLYPSNDIFKLQIEDLCRHERCLLTTGFTSQCDQDMKEIVDLRTIRSNKALDKIFKMNYINARKFIVKEDIFPVVTQSICFRKEYFEKYGLYNEDYYLLEDVPETLKVLKLASKVSVLHINAVSHRSNVGISTSNEFFPARREKYFLDQAKFAEKEIAPCKEVYGVIHRFEIPRIFWFQYHMSSSKKKNENRIKRCLIIFRYVDTILYYIFFCFGRLMKRLKGKLVN